jgi:hypothetical protein
MARTVTDQSREKETLSASLCSQADVDIVKASLCFQASFRWRVVICIHPDTRQRQAGIGGIVPNHRIII